MEKCLQCSKELNHVPGRKQKSFCDVNCRNKYFYAKRKKEIEDAKALMVSLPPCFTEVKNVAILTSDGKVKPIFPKPNKKPKNKEVAGLDKTIDFHKRGRHEAYDAPRSVDNAQDEPPKAQTAKPKNLEELKALCPHPEKSDERSEWIRIERPKYGI